MHSGVNALAVFDLSEIANRLGATLVHISTDYVFDGEAVEPYTELSSPRPISVYANSKLAGEYFVRSVAQKHILIRTCGLYGVAGSAGKGGNFVETMLRKAKAGEEIRVVSDQVVTPTPTAGPGPNKCRYCWKRIALGSSIAAPKAAVPGTNLQKASSG